MIKKMQNKRGKPFSTETRTIGLKSFKELQQSSASVFPPYTFSSGGIKKLEEKSASSVATRSSTNVKLPTPAKTMFLQNYQQK
jgi:hypothetical protein